MVDVSIIIVNYKRCEMTLDAVNSIIEMSSDFSYEIIVVDNSEDENEFNKLASLIDGKAMPIKAESNLGFGKANNLGAAKAKGRYLFFLNNDTKLINNAIFELFKVLEANNNVGIAGSNLYDIDLNPNHSFSRLEKNYHNDKKIISLWFLLFHKLRRKRFDFNYTNKELRVKGDVSGACLFIRKDLFDRLGGFEKDIFMYAEETLLCYRLIHELKLEIHNVPSSKIMHFEGVKVDKKVTPERAKIFVDGNAVYYLKAFDEKICIKYLKMMRNKYKRLSIVKKFLKIDCDDNITFMKAYENKYNELKKESE